MSIESGRDMIARAKAQGLLVTEHFLRGSNLQIPPGSYTPDWDIGAVDSVTFEGTAGRDTLFGGGGEYLAFFLGTRGDDLYGATAFSNAYVDYSGAARGVHVDMSYRGSRSYTDAEGVTRTAAIIGRAQDGFGGTDDFAASGEPGMENFSGVFGVIGSSRRDVMIGGGGWDDFYGGRGDDMLIGGSSHGGAGDDRLIGRSEDGSSVALHGDEGDDVIFGTDGPGWTDVYLIGGAGNDRIFAGAGNERFLTGDEGRDFIDAGAGNDWMDGGVGADVLRSGAGNDHINPDVEYFQENPGQPTDHARDILEVTRADLGDFNDVVLSRAFEAGRDQVDFRAAAGRSFRVYQENLSIDPATGQPFRTDDLADRANTVLQIDQDRDGLGGTVPDADDYFLFVLDAELSLRSGFLLS